MQRVRQISVNHWSRNKNNHLLTKGVGQRDADFAGIPLTINNQVFYLEVHGFQKDFLEAV